jgi:hypothetical protein
LTNTIDRSALIHTPQFNYGEFIYSGNALTVTPNTSGNAIAVDPTRAVIIGGATNNTNTATSCGGTLSSSCFTTSNVIGSTGNGNAGGTDGWVGVVFFNDILSDAASIASANPFLEPGAPQNTNPGANGANTTYLETTPPPFGPTFDFAISDMTTATQTFQVIFTGQTSGQLLAQTPFFIPKDQRSGAGVTPTLDNGLPGSAIVYYLPCQGPGSNPYPAPGGPYTPLTCFIPTLYPTPAQGGVIPISFSGWPGIAVPTVGTAPLTVANPGWLLVSQDINPGVVRMQLDRRAAAGLLEGTYIAQFLVSTYDSQNTAQWPPCGPVSALNPFVSAPLCGNQLTPLPADNSSILVTVRLVVRPTLFLSRNAGFLTGITSSLSTNPLFGPAPFTGFSGINQQQGTSKVPDWWISDNSNPPVLQGNNGANSGPAVCVPGTVAGANYPSTVTTPAPPLVSLPCPISTTAPAPYTNAAYGATAYALNGPGDFSGGPVTYTNAGLFSVPTASTPNMTFLYDAGTVQTPSVAAQQGLLTTRPDSAPFLTTFNSDFQGGADAASQRNDATVHDYYVTAEGAATLSVEAINCTNWTNPAVGNWLAVDINAVNGTYTPICTSHTAATVGTSTAPATFCQAGCTYGGTGVGILDDASQTPGALDGEQITLDFLTKAFSNRPAANGIPTGLYTAQVYVWSTRAKNVAPGYCLGASMPASPNGIDPTPLCGSTGGISPTNGATDNNPHPEILVSQEQTFNVTLYVFDTTQIIQITPNSCPASGFVGGTPVTQFVTVANSENLFTGNPLTGFGAPFIPPAPLAQNYPQFGPNGDALVVFSLLPFQTTGTAITAPCPSNNTASCVPPLTGQNYSIPLPTNVAVNPQTLAQYNACQLPTGTFQGAATYNGLTVNGAYVPGIGTLQLTGAQSQTVFVPAPNGSNTTATIYACRPTVAPAWLNFAGNGTTTGYPGSSLTAFPGAPEEYSSGNGAAIAPVPSTSSQTCALSATGGGTGVVPLSTTRVGVFRNSNSFLLDSTGAEQFVSGSSRFITTFIPPGGNLAGDVGVSGDWTGDTKYKVGIYRPSAGLWFLDSNNDGLWDAGDAGYPTGLNFGGIAGDVPVTGDWAGLGKSCIGIFRSGFFWILDTNCNGTFDSATDANFPFGGLAGDVPVVGAWGNGVGGTSPTRVGVVRKYAPGGVPQGNPFYWILDSANATAGNTAAIHQPSFTGNTAPFAYGGLAGDAFVSGDWQGNGIYRAGIYRSGSWILDLSGNHTYDTFFQFGGLSTDTPITGKW